MGCELRITIDNGDIVEVLGNGCPRGIKYAQKELTSPERTVTGTVALRGSDRPVISVKTVPEVPKDRVYAVADALSDVVAEAPIQAGECIVRNIAGTSSNLIATCSAESVASAE